MSNNRKNVGSLAADPAYNGTLPAMMKFCLQKFMQGDVSGMLPARVLAYDRTANRVQVEILIMIVSTGGNQYPRPQLASIPVFVFGGGNLMMSFPLKTGDLGWILANDRDISLFLQTYENEPPNTARMFSFSDSVFFPDIMREYTINTEDADAAVLSTVDGTIRIAISSTGIKITSPPEAPITLAGNVVVTGALEAQGGISGSGGAGANPFILTGNLFVVGDINASGTITPGVPPP